MTTLLHPIMSLSSQSPHTRAQTLQNAALDDVLAMAAVLAASAAYLAKGTLWAKPDPYRYKMFERPQQQMSGGSSINKRKSRDLSVLLQEANDADVAVLWASQSGTAECMAERLAKELSRHLGAKVVLLDLADVEPASCSKVELQGKVVIFLASTFGEGDPSDNMHEFWAWLHQSDKKESLANLRYLAFGLGNSNYKHYNHVINVLSSQLQALGAQLVIPVGKADDAAGETEEHFLEWKEKVFELFQTTLGYQSQEVGYEPSLEIVEDSSLEPIDLHQGVPPEKMTGKTAAAQSKIFALPITESRELFSETGERNCIHMELDLTEHPELKYKTGDHLGVWPVNPIDEIERLVHVLGLEDKRATPCLLRSLDGTAVKVPSPTTINAFFEHYLEICAPVSREHVSALTPFASTTAARDFLSTISGDKAAYSAYLSRNYVNLSRLLQAACSEPGAWKDLPLALVVEILPAMQPRYYSISSSSVVQARRASITAVVADTALSTPGERIPGLATNYLLSLSSSSSGHPRGLSYTLPLAHQPLLEGRTHPPCRLHAHIRKSAFKLPLMASTPILMVGAGTGVAPFRAFVQERARLKTMGWEVGTTKLFF
jgi:NADPH-ferrihemoprotein reductase